MKRDKVTKYQEQQRNDIPWADLHCAVMIVKEFLWWEAGESHIAAWEWRASWLIIDGPHGLAGVTTVNMTHTEPGVQGRCLLCRSRYMEPCHWLTNFIIVRMKEKTWITREDVCVKCSEEGMRKQFCFLRVWILNHFHLCILAVLNLLNSCMLQREQKFK